MSPPMAGDDYVTLRTLHDPVVAEMMLELLRQEGLAVDVSGLNHRAMLGMVGSFVAITIRVRESDRERAEELVELLEGEPNLGHAYRDVPVEPPDEATEEDDAEPEHAVAPRDRRRKRIAAGAAFIFPGGAHFYARRTGRGFWIVVAYAVTIATAVAWDASALWALPLVALADVLGGLAAVERFNRGGVPGGARAGRWMAYLAPLFALVPPGATWALSTAAPEVYVGEGGVAVCEHRAECGSVGYDACVAELAEDVRRGAQSRERLAECGRCVDDRACATVWTEVTCAEPSALDGSLTIDLGGFGAAPVACRPGRALRGMCGRECRGVLPEEGRTAGAEPVLDPAFF